MITIGILRPIRDADDHFHDPFPSTEVLGYSLPFLMGRS
jgi:hypothetical protein